MTNYSRRIFEMLVRTVGFRTAHKDLIASDSRVGQLFQKVEAAVGTITAQATLQTSGKNDVRISSEERDAARSELRASLDSICATAASIGLKQFFLPRQKNDRAVANVARVFLPLLEPLAPEFIASHLPEDFIDRLKAAVGAIERSIEQQNFGKDARKIATATIVEAQAEALEALAKADPIIENLLHDNEPVKAAWYAARRVEKKTPKKAAASSPPPTPPETAAATAAA